MEENHARQVMTQMKGSIGVTSMLHQGSTFWLELPLAGVGEEREGL